MKPRNLLLLIIITTAFARPVPLFGQAILIGYSDVFKMGNEMHEYPSIIGYSGVFDMNSRGQYFEGYSGLFELNATFSFIASPTAVQPFMPVQFTPIIQGINQPVSWLWNFGDLSFGMNRLQQNPVHHYTKSGHYTVRLTVTDINGVQHTAIKNNYILVGGAGIHLQIAITNPGSALEITKVGYHYKTKQNKQTESHLVTFDVVNGEAFINNFPALAGVPEGSELITSFDNQIILFDQNNTRRGQIHFEYEPENELGHRRDAILILHNDNEICAGNAFPYSTDSPEYDPLWKYYQIGEYPVSMLIPPNNTFQSNYTKMPLLLIHGWEGAFVLNSNPDAVASANETSYWFTTVYELNKSNYPFDAWQYYYPYNDAHKHLAICLKSALEKLKTYYLNQKIRLVTHSMGGLVTLQYLTEYSPHAINYVEKVLFSAPPAHGSLGANLYYKTPGSPLLESAIEMDANAPAVRDMKLGSDATWFIYDNALPDLNNSGVTSDDYFSLIGTTYKWYLSDKKFLAFDRIGWWAGIQTPHSSVHPEAANHHDGIVAISSASLLNKGVGFATFHGNHNDAKNMQSFKRGNKNRQNIGESTLLPEIIKQYFTQNQTGFFSYLQGEDNITAVVKPDRTVLKPAGQNTIGNLNTSNGVNYQKGILTIELTEGTGVPEYRAYYHAASKTLGLSVDKIKAKGYSSIGVFKRVINNNIPTNRYFYNDKVFLAKDNSKDDRSLTYNGCAIELKEGVNTIFIEDQQQQICFYDTVLFRFCETRHKTLNTTMPALRTAENNYTDSKSGKVLQAGAAALDSLLLPFYIDDQAVSVRYSLSSFESVIEDIPVWIKLKLPDGTIADSTFAGSNYHHNKRLGIITMELNNPMPGLWHIWLETEEPVKDEISYAGVANIQSDVYAFLEDTTSVVAASVPHALKAGLQVDDLNLTSGFSVIATIINPDWEEEVFDITASATMQDSCFIFSLDYNFDLSGNYRIKYNIDGVYNTFNFERCLHQFIRATDTIPVLSIPDITLRQNNHLAELDLLSYTRNINDFDTIYFSSEIISSNIDTLVFTASFDASTLRAYLHTNLSDTGLVVIRYVCHYDENVVADTVMVNILLPDIALSDVSLSETTFGNQSEIIVDYSLNNTGNFHTGAYEVRYYITQDSSLQLSDFALGAIEISYHTPDSLINITDTIQIPEIPFAGNYYLMIKADATGLIAETDEENNIIVIPIMLNLPPDPPTIISALPGNEEVYLSWTANYQTGITGYVIHYGTDTTAALNQVYPFSTDTTYLVTGLTNDSTYYFAVSCYRTFDNPSALSAFVSATPRDISEVVLLNDITLTSDSDTCFSATQTIIVSDFIVENEAMVRLIAGENIQLLPLTQVQTGAHFHAFIDTTGTFCQQPESILSSIDIIDAITEWRSTSKEHMEQFFKVFPNPTTGYFTLELLKADAEATISVSIFTMMGEIILQTELPSQKSYEFNLSNHPLGIYLIRVIAGDEMGVEKVIRD